MSGRGPGLARAELEWWIEDPQHEASTPATSREHLEHDAAPHLPRLGGVEPGSTSPRRCRPAPGRRRPRHPRPWTAAPPPLASALEAANLKLTGLVIEPRAVAPNREVASDADKRPCHPATPSPGRRPAPAGTGRRPCLTPAHRCAAGRRPPPTPPARPRRAWSPRARRGGAREILERARDRVFVHEVAGSWSRAADAGRPRRPHPAPAHVAVAEIARLALPPRTRRRSRCRAGRRDLPELRPRPSSAEPWTAAPVATCVAPHPTPGTAAAVERRQSRFCPNRRRSPTPFHAPMIATCIAPARPPGRRAASRALPRPWGVS